MITTKEELSKYLEAECTISRRSEFRRFFGRLISYDCREIEAIRRFLMVYRKYEYYHNQGVRGLVPGIVYRILYTIYSDRLNIVLPINRVGCGLKLFHTYKAKTMIAGKVGRNVIIRPGVVLANQGNWRTANASPTVEDFVEFSFGVRAFGPIHIGRGALIGANAVLLSNVPPYSIIVGNPGKVVGFVKTPSQIIEFEKKEYPENERLSQIELEQNYKKYYLDRIDEIRKIIGLE